MGLFKKKINTPESRRAKNIKILKKQGITVNKDLPLILNEEIKLKSFDEVNKRAKASFLAITLAISIIKEEPYQESFAYILQQMKELNLTIDDFYELEKSLIVNKFTSDSSDVDINVNVVNSIAWDYEKYYVLAWALSLISNRVLKKATETCDQKTAAVSYGFLTIKELSGVAKLRSVDEILNLLDLYRCYAWACKEKEVNPKINIGKLNPDVVYTRLKSLIWLANPNVDNWNKIQL